MSASATRDDWLAAVAKALKSDPDAALDRLRSTTYDGIIIEPLYTADGALEPAAVVRGSRRGGWDVRQLVDAAAGPGRAVDELERGATSILLDLTGVAEITADGVSAALDGVLLDVAPVVLHAGTRWREAADAFTPPAGMHGLGADPIGEAAVHPSAFDLDEHLTALAGWFDRNESLRPITVDAARYHDAGASDAEQLGCAIAVLVDYLRALGEHGVDPDTVLHRSELRLAATADQFATIASIRAIRRLCARVGEVVGAPAGVPPVHAVTSRAMMTRYDPWVNALRSTVACFAAGVAGADAVTVLPHDGLLGAAELGRRVARNTQSILVAESHLAEVVDPAGGSWYVERFTDQLAEAAWSWFQEIERAGGFRRAAVDGLVAERIAATAAARQRDIDRRMAPLTGLSEFPNVAEAMPPPAPEPANGDVLAPHRWAEGFEALRGRVDQATTSRGSRPSVFLATIGPAAAFTPRAAFAENLFGIAGLACTRGEAADFAASGSTVACICSSDALYAEHAADIVAQLEAAGANAIYLAGKPQAGIDRTIHAGIDARAALSECSTCWRSVIRHCVPRPRRPLLVVRSLALAHLHRRQELR